MPIISRRGFCTALGSATAAPLFPAVALAAAPRLRFATLAPRNSLYHRALLQVGEAWRKAEGNGATVTVFTDGVQGGEEDLVRRMNIGQLNGAMISADGLRAIEPGAAALQYMPMVFRSWEEVDAASARLRPLLEQRIALKGFVVLYWGEAGWVRFFTKQPAVRPEEFRRLKIAGGAGNPEQVELMHALGYRPVALETGDMMTGLQTGMVDAVPTIGTLALAMQMDTVAPHMLDLRWAPIVGAVVITRKAWDATSAAGQQALREAATLAAAQLRAARESADQQAIDAMRKRGLTVHAPGEAARSEWEQLAAQAYPRIRGGIVPADMFDMAREAVAAWRSSTGSR